MVKRPIPRKSSSPKLSKKIIISFFTINPPIIRRGVFKNSQKCNRLADLSLIGLKYILHDQSGSIKNVDSFAVRTTPYIIFRIRKVITRDKTLFI